MKNILLILFCLLLFTGCSVGRLEIDDDRTTTCKDKN